MGGYSGEVRGKSKIETYLNYLGEIERVGGPFNSHEPPRQKKKLCKSLMKQDPKSEEWILPYHFHT